jgi:hypothetical protein
MHSGDWENGGVVEWTAIVAGGWCLVGMIITGVCLIRDGIHYDT